jgi:hypothetical protein
LILQVTNIVKSIADFKAIYTISFSLEIKIKPFYFFESS